jgi:hypothetical protein
MTTLDSLKNDLISHIMASKNEKLLKAIENILDSTKESNVVSLSPQQIEVLMKGEHDIDNDRNHVFEYWKDRNKSTKYSQKLRMEINDRLTLLIHHSKLGRETDFENTRVLSMAYYSRILG